MAGPQESMWDVGEYMFLTCQDYTLADVKGMMGNVRDARKGNREAPGPPSPHLSGSNTHCCAQATLGLEFSVADVSTQGGLVSLNHIN